MAVSRETRKTLRGMLGISDDKTKRIGVEVEKRVEDVMKFVNRMTRRSGLSTEGMAMLLVGVPKNKRIYNAPEEPKEPKEPDGDKK